VPQSALRTVAKAFAAQFINTALVVLLVNADLSSIQPAFLKVWMSVMFWVS
jgi:hypothetical protein